MKQLPHVSSALYGMPWSILPQSHAELSSLYQGYIRGTLQAAEHTPRALSDGEIYVSYGITIELNQLQGIGILHLEGIISKRAPEMLCGPPLVDLAILDGVLDQLAANDAIHTIIFDWNSPGGMMVGLEETSARIRELAEAKRIIAYCDFQCCSAAYWLACCADEIYFAPSAIVGSIGTYIAGLDDSRAWEFEGLELVLAKSGNLKAMGHPGKAWSEEERKWLQEKADSAGKEFRAWVTSRRPKVSEETMQGQWFAAKQNPELSDGLYRDLPALLAELMQAV